MIVACDNCGAPLDVPPGKVMTPCTYCGQTNRVRSMRTLHEQTPANWMPPATWKHPAAPQASKPLPRPSSTKSGTPGCGAAVILVIVLVAVGIPLYLSGALSALPFFGLELDGAPSLREVDLDTEPTPAPISGSTGSGVSLDSVGGSGCRGQVDGQPHVVLRTSANVLVDLSVDADFDSVMALRTEDGVFHCDDDSNGHLDPRIETIVPAGEHRVWVGAFSAGNGGDFTLSIRGDQAAGAGGAGPIAFDAPPTFGTIAAGSGVQVFGRFDGTAFGESSGSEIDGSCRGYYPSAPHLGVQVDGEEMVRFTTRAASNVDLVMMVRDANGRITCDDDSGGGLQPQIDLLLPVGMTHVWVGVFHQGERGEATFELLIGAPGNRNGEVN